MKTYVIAHNGQKIGIVAKNIDEACEKFVIEYGIHATYFIEAICH